MKVLRLGCIISIAQSWREKFNLRIEAGNPTFRYDIANTASADFKSRVN